MPHLSDIAELLTKKHLTLFLRLAIVRGTGAVNMSSAIFIGETENNLLVGDAVCATIPTDLVPPFSK